MVRIIFCVALLMDFLSVYSQNKNLCGQVIDKETNQPVTFASVYFKNGSFGTFTDEQGHFCLQNIPQISDSLFISHIGYQTKSLVINDNDLKHKNEFYLKPSHYDLPEVAITGKKFKTKKIVQKAVRNYWRTMMHDEYISRISFFEVGSQDDECLLYREGEAYLVSLGYDWKIRYGVYNFFPYQARISKLSPSLKHLFNKHIDTVRFVDFRFQTDALLHRFRQIEDDLLSRNIISKYSWPRYKYKLDSIIQKYNRDMAFISFYHPKSKYLNGSMMIDLAKKQILKIDIEKNLAYSKIFNDWIYPVRYSIDYATHSSKLYPAQITMEYQKEGIKHYTQINLFEVPSAIQKQSNEFKSELSRANAKLILQGEDTHSQKKTESGIHGNQEYNCTEALSFYKQGQPFPYRHVDAEEIKKTRQQIERIYLKYSE